MLGSNVMDPRYLFEVQATPSYVGEKDGKHLFSYEITITNQGSFIVQLMRRRWLITDGNGNTEEVQGDGVVGEQPTLVPGDSYTYKSGAILTTEVGSMRGSYTFQAVDGLEFEARIPTFTLATPGALN